MTGKQLIGVHVSAAGGVENAPERAKELGAECFQFFSRSPRGGAAPEITEEKAAAFKAKCEAYGMETYIHTPYYINFAATKKDIAENTVRIIREEMERASKLGVKYVITHLGSANGWPGAEKDKTPGGALKRTWKGLRQVFHGKPDWSARLLLEISAGSGNVIGDTFDELAFLLKNIGKRDLQVCLDTCHMFASGYDVRNKEAWDETLEKFEATLGLRRLKLVHVNDSKTDLGGHVDRHEHLGKGKIGEEGFKAMLTHPALQEVNFILETKHDEGLASDIEFLKENRKVM